MIRVRVRNLDDTVNEIEATEGETLLEAMLNAGVSVKATCYGCCNCSTCHVTLGCAWYDRLPPPEEQECDVLELAESRTRTSRLSCQLILQSDISGLEVALTAEAAA